MDGRKHIWEMLEKLQKGQCFKSDVMDAVDAYTEAGNSGKPIVSGRSEQLFCHNCKTFHTNKDYEGFCCQSCFDGVEAK